MATDQNIRKRMQSTESIKNRIVALAESPGEAIAGLYLFLKPRDKKYSLAFICRAAGIPSTGYLSDICRGKKVLHQKYIGGIITAFKLEEHAARRLYLLLERQKPTEIAIDQNVESELHTLSKTLLTKHEQFPTMDNGLSLTLVVFGAFGIFRNTPSTQNLIDFFADYSPETIERALATLEQQGLIAAQLRRKKPFSTRAQVWSIIDNQVLFGAGKGLPSHLEFLESSLAEATTTLEHWFDKPRESHISATIISVSKKVYEEKLQTMKADLIAMPSALESSEADTLIRFNIQIFPIR